MPKLKTSRMKVKARDIHPGWPRGRSTSFWSPPEVADVGFLIFGRANWATRDMTELILDTIESALYHQRQAEMLERHRTRPLHGEVSNYWWMSTMQR